MPTKLLALIAAVGALIVLPLSASAARAEKRVALVIGNGVYQNVPKLANPIKDAASLADMFRNAGFDWVKLREDVSNLEFKRALREFMDAAQDADIAVVYYAGHGIQVRDMNYMIPVDAKLATEVDAEDEAVSLERIMMALEPAKRLRLVILDACRDNPFARTMKRRVATRAIGGGLAMMEPMSSDTLIAYAAKAGSIAEDGGGENSPFAAALVKHLSVPGLDIRLAFGRVRDDVLKRSRTRQEPFIYGSLGGESISLVPAPQEHEDQARAEREEKARAEREAAQQREEKARVEREAAQQREEKTRANREATQQREAETRRLKAVEAPREAAEREAARKREEAARLAKLTEQDRRPQDDTCSRDDEKLARLRGSLALGWAREDLKRLQRDTACDRVRSDVAALLDQLAAPEAGQWRGATEPPAAREGKVRAKREGAQQDDACSRDDEKLARLRGSLPQGWAREDLKRLQRDTPCDDVRSDVVALLGQLAAPEAGQPRYATEPPPANSPELILSAQRELQRLGCFDGEEDGRPGSATTAAIRRYLLEKGRPSRDIKVTDTLIAELKDQSTRVCPLTCSRGEHAEGDRCVVDAKPEKQETPRTTSRQRNDEDKRRAGPMPSTSRPGGKN
ncbi:MAG: caspase family protein [Xanthobacteraceae bacterium]